MNFVKFFRYFGDKGGGGKALTITMTPWNFTHGQWSKNLTMATETLDFPQCGQFEHFGLTILKTRLWSHLKS